ncbi:MAG: VCBS repeat-containing protein [SAR324 cluster bacterium]|nr:VCBS repeat-containing protein [SAR324 cluster bacterium]
MQKNFILFIQLFSLACFLLLSTACSFKERELDDDDETATSTEISIIRIDNTTEELKFHDPLELDNIGKNPLAFVIKDINHDQLDDIILLNTATKQEEQTIRILIRTSVNSSDNPEDFFETGRTIITNTDRPQYLLVEDVNEDGVQDLLTISTETDSLSVWEGQITNNKFLLAATPEDIDVGDFPVFMTAAPFASEGKMGVAIANRGDDDISIVLDFNSLEKISLDYDQGVGKNPIQVASGDWNNDGCVDLAVLSRNKNRVDFFENTPCSDPDTPQNKVFQKIRDYKVGELPQALIAGDWDNDGNMDVATTNQTDEDISLLYGHGDGSFERKDIKVGQGPGQLSSGDLNQDGVQDFVIGDVADQDLVILLSNGDGKRPGENGQKAYSRGDIVAGSIPSGNRPGYIQVIDINHDEKQDIVLTLPFENKLAILLQK